MSRRIAAMRGGLGDDGVENIHGQESRLCGERSQSASLDRHDCGRHGGISARIGRMDPHATALSPRALELAQTLVRMNTVSANSNLELIHFVRDELAAARRAPAG